jgi:hypothetical protein
LTAVRWIRTICQPMSRRAENKAEEKNEVRRKKQ